MTGAEYIAEFLALRGCHNTFVLTGGACAFILDAVARHPRLKYYCFQHEQAAAMAADAVWRVSGKPGVTIATSGPGATNLITGIACSYFDSIPTVHITGQVNKAESAAYLGARVRQAGFQETNIVDMVKPITKYAVQVNTVAELRRELMQAFHMALSERMGPVLLDVPMNVQKEEAGSTVEYEEPRARPTERDQLRRLAEGVRGLLAGARRPLVLVGAGVGLAGVTPTVMAWLQKQQIPFVASWNGMCYFNHDHPSYCGHIGVYGNRGANYILQNCDALLVLGSRLDNRQRSGNTRQFAPAAKVLALDVDAEELKKYANDRYSAFSFDLKELPGVLSEIGVGQISGEWKSYIGTIKKTYFGKRLPNEVGIAGVSPYGAVQKINQLIDRDAVVVADCGANLCWVYQVFHRTEQLLFTAGGNSPMGYSLPAAIGATLEAPNRQVVCFIGDGGLQINIQELQTISHYRLPIKIVILNNTGYGIIKQFQDSYFDSRYIASGEGYSVPNFQAVFQAYDIPYVPIKRIEDLDAALLKTPGPLAMDVMVSPNALIQPKLEMGRPINDQFPYVSDEEFAKNNPFVSFTRAVPKT